MAGGRQSRTSGYWCPTAKSFARNRKLACWWSEILNWNERLPRLDKEESLQEARASGRTVLPISAGIRETQGKGSFKMMTDDVADALGVDIIVPESSIKPSMNMLSALASFVGLGSRIFKSEIVLGIREVSRPLQFESSYTVLQHAPVESIETEIVPQAVEMIETLKTAWREGNHRKVVGLVGQEVRRRQPRGRRVPKSCRSGASGRWLRRDYSPSLHPYATQPFDGAMGLQADDRRRYRTAPHR